MATAIRKVVPVKPFKLFISGGGAHNPLLSAWVANLLPHADIARMEELGVSGDAKEAVLFALLANESLAGGKTSFGSRPNVPSVSMGKISFPY